MPPTSKIEFHQKVVAGVELEAYTILIPEMRISRELAFPRKGVGEKGERFGRDTSIGTEYNSRPFSTVREGLFLLKSGLRKYSLNLYKRKTSTRKGHQLFLAGGWRDRYAGAHVHLSLAGETLSRERARLLAFHIHDHIPLLVAMGANSPVWAEDITPLASNRIVKASKIYFHPIHRSRLTSRSYDEILFSRGRKTKPPTLEIRVLDSNIPEFVMAAVCVIKAAALSCLAGRGAANKIKYSDYLKSRRHAAGHGMKAKLCWNGKWISASSYLDRFVWTFRDELQKMDVPQEIWTTLKLLKKGYNGSAILGESARDAYHEHPQSWQRRFAGRYVGAVDALLSGNTILDFAKRLRVKTPGMDGTWLGRKKLDLS